ncbi:hypothetical protein [Brucella intermedia]|uniref:hypothetical protein n=1 Tax=Brucella intermedia TaxID=94625 RepID=UPI00235F96EB|nr:hypothetical protein [Brucella intermedia]
MQFYLRRARVPLFQGDQRFCHAEQADNSYKGSVAKILPMSERVLTIFSETFDERFQMAPFSG